MDKEYKMIKLIIVSMFTGLSLGIGFMLPLVVVIYVIWKKLK